MGIRLALCDFSLLGLPNGRFFGIIIRYNYSKMASVKPMTNLKVSEDLEIIREWDLEPAIEMVGENFKHPDEWLSSYCEKGSIIGTGSEADIYQINDPNPSGFCVKKMVRTSKKTFINPGILEEMDRQREAAMILKKLPTQKGIQARVPRPLLAFNDPNTNADYIVMDFVPGKTIYRMILELIIEEYDEKDLEGWTKEKLMDLDDETFSTVVATAANLSKLFEIDSEAEKLPVLLSRLRSKGKKFIKREFFEAMENAVSTLNRHGFYHRDLHSRNIMLSEDTIWLIDFGYSVFDPKRLLSDPYEERKEGEDFRFPSDKDMLNLLAEFVIEPDLDTEEARLQAVEKELRGFISNMRSKRAELFKLVESPSTKEEMDNSAFVKKVVEDRMLAKLIKKAIMYNEVDNLERYVKMISLYEWKNYQSTSATQEFFESKINMIGSNKSAQLKLVKSVLTLINPHG